MPNTVGQDLLNVPFGEMVEKLGIGIANAQTRLDSNSTELAKTMATTNISLPSIKDPSKDLSLPLIALGFFPGFYQFAESVIEVKMAITMAQTTEKKIDGKVSIGWGPFSASVNASYSSKYDYKVEGSSLLRTRLVPVPPPAMLQEYMEALVKALSGPLTEEKLAAANA